MSEEKKRGRPSAYTAAIAAEICARLANGESLNAVCKDESMPPRTTVIEWVLDDREGFSDKYARARRVGYELIADELLDISDDGTNDYAERENKSGETYKVVDQDHISRSRLRVDTRKWLLSKALPKIYGDKVTNEHTGKDGSPIGHAIEVSFVGSKPGGTAGGVS